MANISNKELDMRFDAGEDIMRYKKKGTETIFKTAVKKVNVGFPIWMIEALDREAKRIGVTRQALIKTILDMELTNRNAA
ncbi:MAG: CopG family transcriptional regulator [Deltaproteobacteria bacterium]|nr:CopG family transcriptional regulator [Deltaproteobacteria bacterium]